MPLPTIGDHVRLTRASGRSPAGAEGWIVGTGHDPLVPSGVVSILLGRNVWPVAVDACEICTPDNLKVAAEFAPEWALEQFRIAQTAALDFAGVPAAWRP